LAHGVYRFDKFWGDALPINNHGDPQMDHLHYFKGILNKLDIHSRQKDHKRQTERRSRNEDRSIRA
jgi:hypothetical protein